MSFLIETYIRQNVVNPRLSDVYSIQSTIVGTDAFVMQDFANEKVKMIVGFNLVIENANAPGNATFTDRTTNRVVLTLTPTTFPNYRQMSLFYYFWKGSALDLLCDNVNYQFRLYYQKVYTGDQPTKDAK
jgi:hypothetical protein